MAFLGPIAAGVGGALKGVAGFAGTLVSAVGTIVGGQAAANEARYRQEVAEMNARIARDNAVRARDVAQTNQQAQDNQAAAFLGEQLATQAGSGVDLGSRSSLGARKASRVVARQDALNVIQAGELDAYQSLTDASNFDAQAAQAGASADNALLSSYLGAASSLIGATRGFGNRGRITGTGTPRSKPGILV